MATTIKSTALDFNNIKESLKEYFAAQSQFADYDFEASGLSNILDVLSYNTHYNGLIANFALNEAYINSAQLRSSVLGLAQNLGYIPKSRTSATGTVNISLVVTSEDRPNQLSLPVGTEFTASVNDVEYTFYTLEEYTATDDGAGNYIFKTILDSPDIPIYEGKFKTKTFIVDSTTDPVYVIPDTKMDTTTASVKVYTNYSSSAFATYLPLTTARSVDTTTRYYQLFEAPNGHYELHFGDGIISGLAPSIGEVIRVSYMASNGELANTARNFASEFNFTIDGTSYSLNVVTATRAAGGAEKESLASIKKNAPIGFATQNRMVTAQDYVALINRDYGTYLDDIAAWGGEDNVPKEYGVVYVSLRFKDTVTAATQAAVKADIQNILSKNFAVMGIDTKFTDVDYTYIEAETFFNYNTALSDKTVASAEVDVQNLLVNYFNSNLNRFSRFFRRSNILTLIDASNDAILNSRMNVKIQRRFTPVRNKIESYTINYPTALAAPLPNERIVGTTQFVYGGNNALIRNKYSSTTLELVSATGEVLLTNIGSYSPTDGTVNIIGLNIQSVVGSNTFIKVFAKPANESTIRPLRNTILLLDNDRSFTSAQIDQEEVRASL